MSLRRRVLIIVAGLGTVAALGLVASGCNRFGYDAHIDRLDATAGSVTIRGWVHDAIGNGAARCPVLRVAVDGVRKSPPSGCLRFDGSRPDVDAALGGANGSLPDTPIPALTRGSHEICIDVVPNVAADAVFAPLDCRRVNIPYDQFDHSSLDSVVVTGTSVDAAGWYSKIVRTNEDAAATPSWALDGLRIADIRSGPTFTTGTSDRPDAVAAFGPTAVGQTLRIDGLGAGRHELCLGLQGPRTSYLSGVITCRTFTV